MSRQEWMGAAVLLLAALAVGVGLWARDHPAAGPAAAPAITSVVSAGSVLTTMPGVEARAAENPAVVTCRVAEDSIVRLRRAMRIVGGLLYLDVLAGPRCGGWVGAAWVDNYPAWLNEIEVGAVVSL